MQVFVLGLNHKSAPVEVRERLALSPSRLAQALRTLRGLPGISEAAILSTCNRAEFYVAGDEAAVAQLEAFLCEQAQGASIQPHLYRFEGGESARHLFRVASGLDSLVLGESEILGQVKSALAQSREAGTCGPVLDEALRRAIACGKRARTETGIGRGALNVGSAAVELARQIFGPLQGHTVLILGAGKMSALTAQHLVSSGARRILVANRTYARAQELARTFSDEATRGEAAPRPRQVLAGIPNADARAVSWEEFPARLVEADIVISSTRAPHLILTPEHIAPAMRARLGRPLFLIDIAVPRDIDPRVNALEDVYLYDIDDLSAVVESNRAGRAVEAARAESIVDEEAASWQKWLRGRGSSPVASALAQHAQQVRDREVEAALANLGHLSERDKATVAALGRALSSKLLHAPLRHLREGALEHPDDAQAIARAFKLAPSTPAAAEPDNTRENSPLAAPAQSNGQAANGAGRANGNGGGLGASTWAARASAEEAR
jgi:glutamyl-tRNA reductase